MNGQVAPTAEYLKISQEPSVYLPYPVDKHQLLILDLNGTLVSRLKVYENFYARPHHDAFFKFIFEHYHVMVWSSATERSVKAMCKIFEDYEQQLRLVWNRSHFDLAPHEFRTKTDTFKNLEKIWTIMPEFNATNTVMLDDSVYKLGYQPHNLIHLSTFDHQRFSSDHVLLKVMNYLLVLKYQSNIASFMRHNPFSLQQTWGVQADQILDTKMAHFKKSKRVAQAKHMRFGESDTEEEDEDSEEFNRIAMGMERAIVELKEIEKRESEMEKRMTGGFKKPQQPPYQPVSKAAGQILKKLRAKQRQKKKEKEAMTPATSQNKPALTQTKLTFNENHLTIKKKKPAARQKKQALKRKKKKLA